MRTGSIAGLAAVLAVLQALAMPLPAHAQPGCVSAFRNPQRSYPHNEARPLVPAVKLAAGEPLGPVTYRARGETEERTLESYLGRFCMTSFLVLHRGRVVHESYFQGVTADDALLSASMSKSVLALLVGIAVGQDRLSLGTRVADVLPEFTQGAFSDATVEDLLRMSSGAALKNSYVPGQASDNQATNPMLAPRQNMRRYLAGKQDRSAGGKTFDYNGAISALLGLVLSERTQVSNTDYLATSVWSQMGFEGSAYWIKNQAGEEGVQGQFAARPRDWARLGLLVMGQGAFAGRQWVPADWVRQMTTLRADKPQPASPPYYGLHIWIPQAAAGRSQFMGTNGQFVFIDPVAQVVIVHTANAPTADFGGAAHLFPLRDAIVAALSRR